VADKDLPLASMLAIYVVYGDSFGIGVTAELLAYLSPPLLGVAASRQNPAALEMIRAGEAFALVNQREMFKEFYGSS
jgi:hypothetical protein